MTRITDEAVEAAAKALELHVTEGNIEDYLEWDEISKADKADILTATRRALEAALSHLEGATPVATREHLAAVMDPDAFDDAKPKSKAHAAVIQWAARRHMAFVSADRLIAAGVFREATTSGGAS